MSYVSTYQTVLNPDFFQRAALAYNSKPTDRKQWLQAQIINLQSALNNYAIQINELLNEGATLDGKSDVAQWMTSIGVAAISIPTIYTQIGGAVVTVAGSILGALEKKKDSKALQTLAGRARNIQTESGQIKTYYEDYTAELQRLNLLPVGLFGFAAYLMLKK